MTSRVPRGIVCVATLLSSLCFATSFAGDIRVRTVERSAPATLSESIRAALDSDALVVSADEVDWMVLWGSKGSPDAASRSVPGAHFGSVGAGHLVGAVTFEQPWSDYKGNAVAPGAYTLRYWLLPEDGNHMGVALWRDFLLLSPAASDPDPGPVGGDDLFDHSRRAVGKSHPAVLSVFPVPDGTAPPGVFENDLGQATLAVKLGGKLLGLVVAGEGEH